MSEDVLKMDNHSLRNKMKEWRYRWHYDQIMQRAEHGTGLWIALMRVNCWERFRLLKYNGKI